MTNLFFFIFSVLLVSILFFLSKICFRCLSSTPSSEDMAAAEEELKAELAARFKIKEKELRSALDKELERRSRAWTSWFEKYQSEEQRLCERARGLAEQNVSLQRQVSSFNQREAERRKLISNLTAWAKEAMEENQSLQQNLSELQEKYRAAAEDRDFFKRNYEEKSTAMEGAYSTFKLDQELSTRISCLQDQGLSLLNESTKLCSKLLDFIKGKAGQLVEAKQGIELIDGQFIVESGMKIQGFKRGMENLTRSLPAMSALLDEKSNPAFKPQSKCMEDARSDQVNEQTMEVNSLLDITKFELKLEILLTNLLQEKLYSKELEVEQLRAELAAAVRGNDVLRAEVQRTLDDLFCATHKLKDLELQMLKKEENINCVQTDFEESAKQLAITKGVLHTVAGNRDMLWEQVKQCSKENMLLGAEVNTLKKKTEALEEEITILKDSLDNKQEFLLEYLRGRTESCKSP